MFALKQTGKQVVLANKRISNHQDGSKMKHYKESEDELEKSLDVRRTRDGGID